MCGRSPPWVGASPTFRYRVRTSLSACPRRTAGVRRSGVPSSPGLVFVRPSMALPRSSTPTSSNWPLNPVSPVSGLRVPMVSSTRSAGSLSGFPSRSNACGDGFRERRERFGFGHRAGLHQDLLGFFQHPGVRVPGALDGGNDDPGLLHPDAALGQERPRVPGAPGPPPHRRVGFAGGPFSRCSPWPWRPGRRSSAFPAATRRWTRTRSWRRCAGCRPPPRPAPARRTPTGPGPRWTAPTPADPVRGFSRNPGRAGLQGGARGRDIGLCRVQARCPSPYKNPSRDHRQSLFSNGSRSTGQPPNRCSRGSSPAQR